MGAFFLVKRGRPETPAHIFRRLQDHFDRRGFPEASMIHAGTYDIGLYRKRHVGHQNIYFEDEENFCLSTGTILYRNSREEKALKCFHGDFKRGSISWRETYGHFCLILRTSGKLYLLTDRLGIYPVWHDPDWKVISSSFLAVAAAQKKTTINPQSVYEYVFKGASYGIETPFCEVHRIDRGCGMKLGARIEEVPMFPPLSRPPVEDNIETCLQRNLANLRCYYDAIGTCFGDKVDTALSGGYDSRLTLALLLERGLSPNVHVYGSDSDSDVRVARTISDGEEFPLQQTDKSLGPPVDANEFAEITARNFDAFDGFPTDGIFDNGSDLKSRTERGNRGDLMLNGGGGEIYRNFFYLPQRSFSLRQFLWTFYSQFHPVVCTNAFSQHEYLAALGDKVKRAIGCTDDRLERGDIEFLYPVFRCRFWMGKNNGINNALGWALTPFIDANTIIDAVAIPLRYKNFGRFEAEMIRRVNPRLASYRSNYGHNFSCAPPLRRIMKDLTTYYRPPILRRYTYRLKRRSRANWPYYYGETYQSRVLDTSFPYLQKFFRIPRIVDRAQYNRICTLEYLFEKFQPVA